MILAGLGLAAAIAACTSPTASSLPSPAPAATTPASGEPSPVRSLPLPDAKDPSGPSPTIEVVPPAY